MSNEDTLMLRLKQAQYRKYYGTNNLNTVNNQYLYNIKTKMTSRHVGFNSRLSRPRLMSEANGMGRFRGGGVDLRAGMEDD